MRSNNSQKINAPRLTRKQIIDRADRLTLLFVHAVGEERAKLGISFDVLYEEVIYPEYEIELIQDVDLGTDAEGCTILGQFAPIENVASIDTCLQPRNHDPRRAFTCYHEVGGHGVLQGEWLRSEMKRIRRNSSVITTEVSITPDTENQLERQANLFASHLAAPTWLIVYAIQRTFELQRRTRLRYIGPGEYTFCARRNTYRREVQSFDEFCQMVAYYIRRFFGGLSVEALGYRVADCPLVRDETRVDFSLFRKSQPLGQGMARRRNVRREKPLVPVDV